MQKLDGDALDDYLKRVEKTFQDESDRLLSETKPKRDVEGIYRMRGAADAAASIRKQLHNFKIPDPPPRAPRASRAQAKKDPT